jgi:outer membrane protein TolC
MARTRRHLWIAVLFLSLSASACVGIERPQPPIAAVPPQPVQINDAPPPAALGLSCPAPADRPLLINLPTALQLAGTSPVDIALASERIQAAVAQLDRARVLWLPTIQFGGDYFRHDGQIQDVAGNVFGTSKSALLVGGAPVAVFAVTDALFEPLAARQTVQAREAALQAARNDTLLSVAEAYFSVQQARGELAGAVDAVRRADELVQRTTKLSKDLVAPIDVARARTELARRRQAAQTARERWRTASAELARILRLEPSSLLEPLEPPHLQVTLIPPESDVAELIPVALTNRPELAAQQAIVQATLTRLREERWRPLLPSVLLRGASTNPAGTLAGGYFGGGTNSSLRDFGARSDFDVQVLWELRGLGLDNLARVNERRSENRQATLEAIRLQDRVAAEVAQALAQLQAAFARLAEAEQGVKEAVESANRHLEGMEQTQRVGNVLLLVIRPQEVVAAVQALAQAYADYYVAVGDYDRAQFRLYRALGQPAQALTCQPAIAPTPAPAANELPRPTEAAPVAPDRNIKKN